MCPLPPEHPSLVSPHPIPPGCLEYSCFTMLYSVLLYRKVNQLYTYISLLCFGFPPHLCHLIGQLVKNLPAMQETPVWSLGWEDPLEKGKATCSRFLWLPYGSGGKESACNAGDLGSIPGLGRSPGEVKGYPVFWPGEFLVLYIVHGVSKSQMRLSGFHSLHLGHHRVLSRVLCALQEALVSYFNYVSLHLLQRV